MAIRNEAVQTVKSEFLTKAPNPIEAMKRDFR